MDRIQPETDHDLLVSLWTLLIGSNGNGLLSRFDSFATETRARLLSLESKAIGSWTKVDHDAYVAAKTVSDDRKENRRRVSAREWSLVLVAIIGPIIAVLIDHYVK
jgi:hypothetical protein